MARPHLHQQLVEALVPEEAAREEGAAGRAAEERRGPVLGRGLAGRHADLRQTGRVAAAQPARPHRPLARHHHHAQALRRRAPVCLEHARRGRHEPKRRSPRCQAQPRRGSTSRAAPATPQAFFLSFFLSFFISFTHQAAAVEVARAAQQVGQRGASRVLRALGKTRAALTIAVLAVRRAARWGAQLAAEARAEDALKPASSVGGGGWGLGAVWHGGRGVAAWAPSRGSEALPTGPGPHRASNSACLASSAALRPEPSSPSSRSRESLGRPAGARAERGPGRAGVLQPTFGIHESTGGHRDPACRGWLTLASGLGWQCPWLTTTAFFFFCMSTSTWTARHATGSGAALPRGSKGLADLPRRRTRSEGKVHGRRQVARDLRKGEAGMSIGLLRME